MCSKDGIVIASDGQSTELTSGQPTRSKSEKIFQLGKGALWGAAGDVGAIQEIKTQVETLGPAKQGQYSALRKHFEETVFGVNQPRFERFRRMLRPNQSPPTATVIWIQYEGDKPRIVEIAESGASTNYEESGYHAIGSGDILARSSLYGYATKELSLDQSMILAYMTVQKAIDIAAFGLGHPIYLWTLMKKGDSATIERICDSEKESLKDTAEAISKAQLEVFAGWRPAGKT
jgi:20S proteasome alpha/beta subunit